MGEVHTTADYNTAFDPDAYLEHYFSKESIEDGTRVSLFALPVFAHIMKQTMKPEERQTLLDVGAGPTIYSAVCFREVVQKCYLTDYVDKNLDRLSEWLENKEEAYDWKPTIRIIKRTEGGSPPSDTEMSSIEEKTRHLVREGGILFSNVHETVPVPALPMKQADILVSVFCLESACANYDEYKRALGNMLSQLRSGGRFVLGSVLDDDAYNAGRQTVFSLLRLTEEFISKTLEELGMDTTTVKKYVLEEEGVMFLMISKK